MSNAATRHRWSPWRISAYLLLAAAVVYLPFLLTERQIFGVRLTNMQLLNIGLTQVNIAIIMMIGAMSLTFLTGCAGLISIGHAAFYAVGAIAGAIAGTQWSLPFPIVLLFAALLGAVAGVLAGLPSLRVRGLYFVLSTLAVHYIVLFLLSEYQFLFFDVVGVPYNAASIGGWVLASPLEWYFLLVVLVIGTYLLLRNALDSREGLALRAMRDNELAAAASGIDIRILRLKAFAISSAIASLAGALYAYYLTSVTAEFFSLNFAIQFIAMIIIGGMGSLKGAMAGAAVWLLAPAVIGGLAAGLNPSDGLLHKLFVSSRPQTVNLLFGVLVILLLIMAPRGMAGAARQLQQRLRGTRP